MKEISQPRVGRRRIGMVMILLALVVASGRVAAAQQEAQRSDSDTSAESPSEPEARRPPARLAVSPGKMEIEIGTKPVVQSMRLLNLGDRSVEVKVTVAPWDLDDDNQVRVLEPTEQSLDQWMLFNPRSFSIEAHSEQTIRFSIRPRVRPADGEHRAMIYFEEQQPEEGPRVQVMFKLGVAVYAYAGDIVRAGSINAIDVAADPRYLSAAFDISNTGNAHVRMEGQYAVWPVGSFPGVASIALLPDLEQPQFEVSAPIVAAGLLPTMPVLGGTRRQLVLSGAHSLPPGRYVMAVIGALAGQAFRDFVEFSVPVVSRGQVAGEQQQQQ